MRLHPVPYRALWSVVPEAWPHLKRAMDRSEGWIDDALIEDLKAGRVMLWVVTDRESIIGAVVTELIDGYARVALCGGDRFGEWRHEITKIEEWALAAGCHALSFDVRRGWQRMMRRDGYRPNGDHVTKVLHG